MVSGCFVRLSDPNFSLRVTFCRLGIDFSLLDLNTLTIDIGTMASIMRFHHAVRGTPLLKKRLLSSSSLSESSTFINSSYETSNSKFFTSKTNKSSRIIDSLDHLSSNTFLNGLSESYTHSVFPRETVVSKSEGIKKEMWRLISLRQYTQLAEFFIKLTSKSSTAVWSDYLTHEELTYFLTELVDRQHSLLVEGASSVGQKSDLKHSEKFVEAMVLKNSIREIYKNLIFGDSVAHLYDPAAKIDNSSFEASIVDFQNLMNLELNNSKIDLASKWMLAFEKKFPLNQFKRYMTTELWVLKFKIYAGGSSHMWKLDYDDLFRLYHDPMQSSFVSSKSWLEIFNEFSESQGSLKKNYSMNLFDSNFNATLISSIGYSKNIDYLTKYIEITWGIKSDGKITKNFNKFDPSHPSFPSMAVLKAIVSAYSYNNMFFQSMTYLNKFQELYADSIDLSSREAVSFWANILKWGDLSTRFSDKGSLREYIKQTFDSLLVGNKTVTLEMAKQSPDFNYEGYLTFVEQLSSKRTAVMDNLWKLFRESNSSFSLQAYKIFSKYLLEDVKTNETRIYEFLGSLLQSYEDFHLTPYSFNKRHLYVNNTDTLIRQLYNSILIKLIDFKGESGLINQIPFLIEEWALDKNMNYNLTSYYNSKLARYTSILEKARAEAMANQRTESDDDGDEPFLGLM